MHLREQISVVGKEDVLRTGGGTRRPGDFISGTYAAAAYCDSAALNKTSVVLKNKHRDYSLWSGMCIW
jgi:hypothetical protein